VRATTTELERLWKVLENSDKLTSSVSAGFSDLGGAIVSAFRDWFRSIEGTEKSRAEKLADLEAEKQYALLARDMKVNELKMKWFDLQAQAEYLKTHKEQSGVGGNIDRARLGAYGQFLSAYASATLSYAEIEQARLDIIYESMANLEKVIAALGNLRSYLSSESPSPVQYPT